MQRVIAYIDGFNFYFGLKSKGWRRYYWLDLPKLATSLLREAQQLERTKYFTARVGSPPEKRKRQNDYLEALQTLPGLDIFYGQYQTNARHCRHCGLTDYIPQEKMTDVNIAVELMCDAFNDAFDTALLISADSDLVPPVSAVRRLFPHKRVVAAFPPDRSSKELMKIVSAHMVIGRGRIASSLLPEKITKADGTVLQCPANWK